MNILTIEDFQNKLKLKLEKSTQKENLIENEIKEIDNFLNPIEVININSSPYDGGSSNIKTLNFTNSFHLPLQRVDKKLFLEVFKSYYTLGDYQYIKTIDDNEESYNSKILLIDQAKHFCKYYVWLKTQQSSNNSKSKKTNNVLTQRQKLLALHYLGLDFRKYDYIKSAKVLKEIYGHNYDDCRKIMPQLYDTDNLLKSKDNLRNVLNLFKTIGLTDATAEIQKDLDSIKSK
tara:strand:- start:246253 stop:246948 length:696 start_codon:yes stop_codon:yes gene_type:complete